MGTTKYGLENWERIVVQQSVWCQNQNKSAREQELCLSGAGGSDTLRSTVLQANTGRSKPVCHHPLRLQARHPCEITPLPEEQRVAGEGTLDQVHADLQALQGLGASYVLLDTFYDDVEAIRQHEASWRMLTTLTEKVVDLQHEALR
jgi:hypothetical protein